MKLGVFTAMMVEGRVFDGSGRRLPPAEYIAKIAGCGYKGVEWGIADSYALTPAMAEREAEQLGRLSHGYGLHTVAVASGASAHDTDALRRMLDISARFRAPGLRIGLRHYNPLVSYQEQVKVGADDFAKALEIARPYKIRLLLEIHFGFLLPSPSLTRRFLEPFGSATAGAILDPANLVVEGYEAWPIGVELLGDFLDHVHVKNIQWTWTNLDWQEHPTKSEHWQWQLAALDRGQVDWSKVIAVLRAAGYRGWLLLEDFSTRPLNKKLREGRTILSRLLGGRVPAAVVAKTGRPGSVTRPAGTARQAKP